VNNLKKDIEFEERWCNKQEKEHEEEMEELKEEHEQEMEVLKEEHEQEIEALEEEHGEEIERFAADNEQVDELTTTIQALEVLGQVIMNEVRVGYGGWRVCVRSVYTQRTFFFTLLFLFSNQPSIPSLPSIPSTPLYLLCYYMCLLRP
jgi:hypothetical protein